jgi:hypothetical protein
MMSDRLKKKARAMAAGVKSARRHAVAAALPEKFVAAGCLRSVPPPTLEHSQPSISKGAAPVAGGLSIR